MKDANKYYKKKCLTALFLVFFGRMVSGSRMCRAYRHFRSGCAPMFIYACSFGLCTNALHWQS